MESQIKIEKDHKQILEKIKTLRKSNNLTQNDMAIRISKNRTNYNMIENGKKDMSLSLFLKIIGVLKISPISFFKDL